MSQDTTVKYIYVQCFALWYPEKQKDEIKNALHYNTKRFLYHVSTFWICIMIFKNNKGNLIILKNITEE
jgi:hypothetical protein